MHKHRTEVDVPQNVVVDEHAAERFFAGEDFLRGPAT